MLQVRVVKESSRTKSIRLREEAEQEEAYAAQNYAETYEDQNYAETYEDQNYAETYGMDDL